MIKIILTNTNSIDSARRMARLALEQKYAACINIIPKIVSLYEWKGELVDEEEYLVLFKTCQEKVEPLMKLIQENHPYEVPELLSIQPESGNEAYVDWALQQMNSNK